LTVFKHVVKEILEKCKKRPANSAETFMVVKMYHQFVDGILHRQRTSDRKESNKSNLGYIESAFFAPFINSDMPKALIMQYIFAGQAFALAARLESGLLCVCSS
jgi:hypothetical protein